VAGNLEAIKETIGRLNAAGIPVSLFIDPAPAQVKAAHMAGAQIVELHTGAYANAKDQAEAGRLLDALTDAARLAARLGIKVAAGHGLTLRNVRPLLALPEIEEYSIGHSIVARAVMIGFEAAVTEMLELVRQSAPPQPIRPQSAAGRPRL